MYGASFLAGSFGRASRDLVRILFLNWRDIQSPKAGGAELLTHEIAKRLAIKHEVAWFSSRANGQSSEELIDGVRVVRRGSEATTRLLAPAFARRANWDVVVEEINTLPYFAHMWSAVPSVLFIPQLAREVWWYEAPKPIAWAGWAAEPLYLSAYRRIHGITISDSTLSDLRRLGMRAPIDVVPMGVSTPALAELPAKEPRAALVAVGRLVRSKRFDHAIRVLSNLRVSHGSARLTIIGEGRERTNLERLTERLGLADAVRFTGRVDEETKVELMQHAGVLIACAVREGWGLTTTEAARLGTPAVAYDVPGLRDSVIDEKTGLLTAPSPEALAQAIRRILDDRPFYDALRTVAWESWRDVSWDRTAESFERVLLSTVSRDGVSVRG
jgi:glycosyltransferase involved in cell wall biosynthesis